MTKYEIFSKEKGQVVVLREQLLIVAVQACNDYNDEKKKKTFNLKTLFLIFDTINNQINIIKVIAKDAYTDYQQNTTLF